MFLKSLSLTNFRNYSSADFNFSPQTTLVVGPNAAGKTNLLEAIYFLATGRSFRATHDREAIAQGKPFANLKSQISNLKHDDGKELELQILANENGENTSSKRLKVNGIKKRLADFAGNLRAVYFGPEEILLVTGSPSRRRKYLDSVLVQVDREYARALSEYEKVLRQRNRLLLLVREGSAACEQLGVWDPRLLDLGTVLSEKRQVMFNYFNENLSGELSLLFLKSMRPLVKEKQTSIIEREIAAGMTLWGPHRDDFSFMRTGDRGGSVTTDPYVGARRASPANNLSSYGSRGEQRLAVLHLKLAELEFITERTGERPVLLLDDIFSELDENNRGRVLSLLDKQQTIITSTEAGILNPKHEIRNSKQIRMTKIQITKTPF